MELLLGPFFAELNEPICVLVLVPQICVAVVLVVVANSPDQDSETIDLCEMCPAGQSLLALEDCICHLGYIETVQVVVVTNVTTSIAGTYAD